MYTVETRGASYVICGEGSGKQGPALCWVLSGRAGPMTILIISIKAAEEWRAAKTVLGD